MIRLAAMLVVLALAPALAFAAPGPTEAEYLVPPQGGAYDIPVHAGAVCILSFPGKLAHKALASSPEYEIKGWGEDGVAVRANHDRARPSTLALATASGQIKVNVTLHVVPARERGLTLVRFKAATAEEAFDAHVAAEVARQVAPLEAELAKVRRDLDAKVRDRADGLIAERLLRRNEVVRIASHERNDDHVIVHVVRGQLLGEDGYLFFEIENRSGSAYRVASVRVIASGRQVAGPARLASTALDRDPSVIGVVAAGATARGAVVVRAVDRVLGQRLALEIAGPEGRGRIRLDRGIVLE